MLMSRSRNGHKEFLGKALTNDPSQRQVWSSVKGLCRVHIDPLLCTPVQNLNSAEASTNVTVKFSLH